MAKLTQVDYDPFAATAPTLTAVDYDPFSQAVDLPGVSKTAKGGDIQRLKSATAGRESVFMPEERPPLLIPSAPQQIIDPTLKAGELMREEASRVSEEGGFGRAAVAGAIKGTGETVKGLVNVIPLAADTLSSAIANPLLKAAKLPEIGKMPRMERGPLADMTEMVPVPSLSEKKWDDLKDTREQALWLVTNVSEQAPQVAGFVGAAFVPKFANTFLGAMGAMSAGQSYEEGMKKGLDPEAVALSSWVNGGIEVLSEMLPLNAFGKLQEVVKKVPLGDQAKLVGAVMKRAGIGVAALATQAGVESVEETAAQIGQNLSQKYIAGDQSVNWNDGVKEAAILGAAGGGTMGVPHAVTAAFQPLAEATPVQAPDQEAALREIFGTEEPQPAAPIPEAAPSPVAPLDPRLQAAMERLPATQEASLGLVRAEADVSRYQQRAADLAAELDMKKEQDYGLAVEQSKYLPPDIGLRVPSDLDLQTKISEINDAVQSQPTALALALQQAQQRKIQNAIKEQEAAQLNADVRQQGRPQERQGELPAREGGGGIRQGGQAQEIAVPAPQFAPAPLEPAQAGGAFIRERPSEVIPHPQEVGAERASILPPNETAAAPQVTAPIRPAVEVPGPAVTEPSRIPSQIPGQTEIGKVYKEPEKQQEKFTIKPIKGGGILVAGDKDSIRAQLKEAGIKQPGIYKKDEGLEFTKGQAEAVRKALASSEAFDPRMKRQQFRDGLEALSRQLLKGGDVQYVTDEHGRISGRTPSLNPLWFQSMATNPETKTSVADAQKAVDAALAGKRLGVRQARIVSVMLDEITGTRTDPTNIAYVRGELAKAREFRSMLNPKRAEMGEIETAPLSSYDQRPGEVFEEEHYSPEQTAEGRTFMELLQQASTIDHVAAATVIDRHADDNNIAPAARELWSIINEADKDKAADQERANEVGREKPEPGMERGRRAETAQDLFGQDTRNAQAVADAARAKDEKRSGKTDVPVEAGEFFGQGGKLEPDLFDQPKASQAAKEKALSSIKSSDIPLADKIRLASDIENNAVTPDAVAAMIPDVSKKEKKIDTTAGRVEEEPETKPKFPRKQQPDTITIDGVERPTTNSKGQPIAQTEEALRNFWKWFSGSRVVDDQGRPLVVYHGTAADFGAFSEGRHRAELNKKYQGDGFHFTGSPQVASRYAFAYRNQVLRKEDIYPLVESRFPRRVADIFRSVVEEGYDAAWDISDSEIKATIDEVNAAGIAIDDLLDLARVVEGSKYHYRAERSDIDVNDVFSAIFGGSNVDLLSDMDVDIMVAMGIDAALPKPNVMPAYLNINNLLRTDSQKKAKSARGNGYDGVYYYGPDTVSDEPEWVVFDPVQIKSATGNIGTFSPEDPRIQYSFAGERAATNQPTRSKDQSHALRLNMALSNEHGSEWNDAYYESELPDSLSGFAKAVESAFGRKIVYVTPTSEKFDLFNGVYIGGGVVYVSSTSEANFLNIVGHELYHDIERTRPDLIDWYRKKAKAYIQNLPEYQARLNKLVPEGGRKFDEFTASSELLADFMGDAFGHPEFLQELANDNPSKFKAFMTTVQLWLSKLAGKLKGLGSSRYITEVESLRSHLKDVLKAYADGKSIADVTWGDFAASRKEPGPIFRQDYASEEEQERLNRVKNIEEEYRLPNIHNIVPRDYVPAQANQKMVTIYRGVPSNLKNAVIRPGDWVALTNSYASEHGTAETGRSKVIEMRVPADHVAWAGTDMNEWFYVPRETSDADIQYSRRQPKEPTPQKENEGVKGDRFTLRGEDLRGKLRRKIQDEAVRWEHVQEQILEQGGTITEESNVAQAIKLYPGRVAARLQDFNRRIVEPFMEKIAKAGVALDDIGLYMYALHAKERNREIAKINPRFPNDGKPGNSGSGMTDAEADAIIENAKADPKFDTIQWAEGLMRKVVEARLTMLVKEGVMTKEMADDYRATYKNYVPLKGLEKADEAGSTQGAGRGISTGKRIDYRALGRASRAGDVVQNILRDSGTAFILAEKAHVGMVAENFIKANPDDKHWTVDKAPKTPMFTRTKAVHSVMYQGQSIGDFPDLEVAKEYAKQMRQFHGDPTIKVDSHKPGLVVLKEAQLDLEAEIQFIRGNDVVRLQITDPLLVRAYNRLWNQGVSEGLQHLNSYNAWLRQMYTQKNPAWFVLNVFRDVQAVVPYLTGEQGFKFATKTIGNMPMAGRAAWNYYHKKSAGPVMDAMIKRFMEAGGSIGFAYVGDIEAKTKELDGIMHRYTDWKTTLGHFKGGDVKRGMHDIFVKALNSKGIAWIEALNTSFENMSRLATFKAAVDSGLSDAEAAMLAKHVTVNFNTRGEWGPNMNAVWLFSNAGIQGTRGIGHALIYSKHRKQVWALSSGLMMLGMIASLMGDDDDDLIDDADRGKALTFRVGDTQFKWQLPYGWGFFGGMGQLFAQAMKHPEKQDLLAVKMADVTMQHFSPWGNLFTGGTAEMENVIQVVPTIAKPEFQIAFNQSAFGGPLFPENPYDQIKPDSEKAWRSTKGTGYDVVAKWMNEVSGGDATQSGGVSVSPETLKLRISTIFGGVGRLVTDTIALPTKMATGEEISHKNIPVWKSFFADIDSDDHQRRFHEQAAEAKEAYAIHNSYQRKEDIEGAKVHKAEHKAMIKLGEMAESYTDDLKKIRDYEDMVKAASDLTASEKKMKLEMLDQRRIKLTTKYNNKFKKMR